MKKSSMFLALLLAPAVAAALFQGCAGGNTVSPDGSGGSNNSGSGGSSNNSGSGGSSSNGSGGHVGTGGSTSSGGITGSGGHTGTGGTTTAGSGGTTAGSGGHAGTGGTTTTGTGGATTTGTGGTTTTGTGGTTTTGTGGSSTPPGGITFKDGFGMSGTWMGYAFTGTFGTGATVSPICPTPCFMGAGATVCAMGSVPASTSAGAFLGWNLGQTTAGGTTPTVTTTGTGLNIQVTGTPTSGLRAQVGDGTTNWCATLPAGGQGMIPWSSFSTVCYNTSDPTNKAYTVGTPITNVEVLVPGTAAAATPFNFCLTGAASY
jgi:hypothetical protein